MKLSRNLYLIFTIVFIGFAISCQSNDDVVQKETETEPPETKPVKELPERQVKVYMGVSGKWHQMADPANYDKWSYVRTNADGFYTNFIAMWINSYQNQKDPQESVNNIQKAFVKNGAFFETSMEEKVNNAPYGGNNEETDKKYLDLLTKGGFSVDYTSLNYGISSQRVTTLQTYKGDRECLLLAAPWFVGGNVTSNGGRDNKQLRENILATDGMQTDGLWDFGMAMSKGCGKAVTPL